MDNKGWYKIGTLKNGEAIYCHTNGEIGIEKNFTHIVNPSKEEIQEIKGRSLTAMELRKLLDKEELS